MVSEAGRWALTQIILTDILNEIHQEFKKIKIGFMPIKGAFLISSGLAEKMQERKISDLDILVQTKDLEKASKHFSELPQCALITWYKDNYRPTETILKYKYKDVIYTLEIMDRINSDARFLLPSEDLFNRSINMDEHLHYPSAEDAAIIMICHLQSHIPFEYRDSNLKELDVLINQNKFKWNKFWEISKRTGMVGFIYFFLCYYQKEYQVKLPLQGIHPYSILLANWFSPKKYEKMRTINKRVLLDIPFSRRPFKLLFQKVFNTKK